VRRPTLRAVFTADPRYSVFTPSRRSIGGEEETWVKCPVFNCRYEVPVDLEDVARERHRAAHSTEEWASVVRRLSCNQETLRKQCEQDLAHLDADIARVQQWIGEGA
jgi:hypothetical protein